MSDEPKSYVIRLSGLGMLSILQDYDGQARAHIGRLVAHYDPAATTETELLRTTTDVAEAVQFPRPLEAMEYVRQTHGTRPDGKPNRPLTAYTIEIERVQVTDDWLTPDDVTAKVLAEAKELGCTCTPLIVIGMLNAGGLVVADITHLDGCPVGRDGSINVVEVGGKRPGTNEPVL